MGYLYTTFDYYFNIACPKVRRIITRAVKAPGINKDRVTAKTQLKDLYNIYRLSDTGIWDAYRVCRKKYILLRIFHHS
jgi:hypothetical protein